MVRKFRPFRSERKKRSTSEGTPQFPNRISGKSPYHLTSNRNFRIFSPNGKHPKPPLQSWFPLFKLDELSISLRKLYLSPLPLYLSPLQTALILLTRAHCYASHYLMAYNEGESKENLHFDDQSKKAVFYGSSSSTRVPITRWNPIEAWVGIEVYRGMGRNRGL